MYNEDLALNNLQWWISHKNKITHTKPSLFLWNEATFLVSGKLNTDNKRIWRSERPYVIRELHQNNPKVNVWCWFMWNHWSKFFQPSINYWIFFPWTEYIALQCDVLYLTIIFLQDNAPSHWGLHVRVFLKQTSPELWISWDCPILWPPRSPDITPLDCCGPTNACYDVGHLEVGPFPVSLFVRISCVNVVLVDPLQGRRRVVKELARTPLSSGWVCTRSNSRLVQ